MATERQIAANRANAQKSTGPRTPEGKAAVRFNALKHGIDAKSQIIMGEDPAALEQLAADYFEEYQPATPTEAALVEMLVQNLWTMRRMTRIEAEGYESERERIHQPFFREVTTMGQVFVNYPYAFARIGRRIEAAQRNFHLALKELQRLQKAHRQAAPDPFPNPQSQVPESALICTKPQSGDLPGPRSLTPDPASATSSVPRPCERSEPHPQPRADQATAETVCASIVYSGSNSGSPSRRVAIHRRAYTTFGSVRPLVSQLGITSSSPCAATSL